MAINISTLTLQTSPDNVWDALTNPEIVKQWQYGCALITTWEVGSPIEFVAEWQGQVFKQWGIVLEMNPYESLKYSLFAPRPDLEDKPENYFTMQYVLTAESGQTKLQIIQEDNRPNAVQEAPQGEENPILQALKTVAEAPQN